MTKAGPGAQNTGTAYRSCPGKFNTCSTPARSRSPLPQWCSADGHTACEGRTAKGCTITAGPNRAHPVQRAPPAVVGPAPQQVASVDEERPGHGLRPEPAPVGEAELQARPVLLTEQRQHPAVRVRRDPDVARGHSAPRRVGVVRQAERGLSTVERGSEGGGRGWQAEGRGHERQQPARQALHARHVRSHDLA